MFIIWEITKKFLVLLWCLKADYFVYKHLSMELVLNEFELAHTPTRSIIICDLF